MKVSKKVKWFAIISVALVFCFAPLANMSYEVIVQKQVPETYTTVEPYIVLEEVKEPYITYESYPHWQESEWYSNWKESVHYPGEWAPNLPSGNWVWESRPVTRYRTVTKEVTKYREVTKTRLASRPVVETQTRRVSILRYLLR
jgi:hypothetical protein